MNISSSTGFSVREQSNIPTSNGKTLYVGGSGPGNYTKIQDAIDDASDGDTVFVYRGTYYENVIVNKTIDLIGEDKENTVIDGKQNDDVLTFESCQINISCFTIRNGSKYWPTAHGIFLWQNKEKSTIKNCILYDNMYGILIKNTSNVYVSNCSIYDNLEGIMMFNANSCVIQDCTFSNRQRGVSINDESTGNLVKGCIITGNISGGHYGVDIHDKDNTITHCFITEEADGIGIFSDGNTIKNNHLVNNTLRGIILNGNNNYIEQCIISYNGIYPEYETYGIEIFGGENNRIHNCDINNNGKGGIKLLSGHSNIVTANTIANNGYVGIIYDPYNRAGVYTYSWNNKVYLNNFIDNYIQAIDQNTNTEWTDGENGNFWNNHITTDINHDGVGEIPKFLYENTKNDNKPLIAPYYPEKPGIWITHPRHESPSHFYLRNIKLWMTKTTFVFGSIAIRARTALNQDHGRITKVEFYVDGIKRHTDRLPPYVWQWRFNIPRIKPHELTVVVYDSNGHKNNDTIKLIKI
jgi:parallel beta-helix repeat protein